MQAQPQKIACYLCQFFANAFQGCPFTMRKIKLSKTMYTDKHFVSHKEVFFVPLLK